MSRKAIGLSVVLGVIGVVAALAGLQLNWTLDYMLLSSSPAPDQSHTAWVYDLGEAERPPYGEGIAISASGSKPTVFSKPTFVYKGMCRRASVQWKGNSLLVIECDSPATTPSLLVSSSEGISVRVSSRESRP